MEPKKSVKADLERRKSLFFEVGLCVALALTLMAFELIGPREKQEETFQTQAILIDDEMIVHNLDEQDLETIILFCGKVPNLYHN